MTKLYRTFKDSGQQYITENNVHEIKVRLAIKAFAEWLDGFQTLDKDFEIVALQGARKIDRELISALVDVVGIEKAREITLLVSNRHRHYSKWQERANQNAVRNWPVVGSVMNASLKAYAWLRWRTRKLWKPRQEFETVMPTQDLPKEMRDDVQKANDNRKTGKENK